MSICTKLKKDYQFKVYAVVLLLFSISEALGQNQYNLGDFCTENSSNLTETVNELLKKGDVYIPEGKWKLSKRIYLPEGRNLMGAGQEKTVLYTDEPLRMVEVTGSNNSISDIYFKGPNKTTKAAFLVYKLRNTKNLSIHDCHLEGATGGIFIEGICDSIHIADCRFSKMYPADGKPSSGYGIVFHHNKEPEERGIFNAKIERNVFDETVYRHSIYLQLSENIEISDNVFYGSNEKKISGYEYQINIVGCKNLFIHDNTVIGGYGFVNGGMVTEYHGRGSDFLIINNLLIGNVSSNNDLGVINARFDNCTITNNTFVSSNTYGIHIGPVKGTIITDNKFVTETDTGWPFIEFQNRQTDILTIKGNNFISPSTSHTPSILLKGIHVENLTLKNNNVTGGEVGVLLSDSSILQAFIVGNRHDGKMIKFVRNKFIEKMDYSNNSSKEHPEISVEEGCLLFILNNTN